MKWTSIKEEPKQKGRNIFFVQLYKGRLYQGYLASSYQDAWNFRDYEMKNVFTHWCYITIPKK